MKKTLPQRSFPFARLQQELLEFNSDALCNDLISRRCRSRRISLRQAARQIGVGKSTLERIELGSQPDLVTFARLCRWLGQPMEKYFRGVKVDVPLKS